MFTIRNERLSRRTAAIALALLSSLVFAAPALADPGGNASGNSEASAACGDGGYQDWTDAAGDPFRNAGACVSYAARGGTLLPIVVNPFSVAYGPSGTNGFRATVTGTGLQPESSVDFMLSWGSATLTIGYVADSSGGVTFVASGVCTSAGSPLTAVGVAGTPAGGDHTEYSLSPPDASICPPPA